MGHFTQPDSTGSRTSARGSAAGSTFASPSPFTSSTAIAAAFLLISACAQAPRQPLPSTAGNAAPADTLAPTVVPGVEFGDARAVAADPLGYLYVADAGRHVVVKLRPTGAVERVLGGPGSSDGEFDEPSGVDPTNGLILFVADAGNHRIQKFSRSYAFLGSVALTLTDEHGSPSRVTYRQNDRENGGFATGRPIALASSGAKDLYAIDADRNVVLKWDDNLRLSGVVGDVAAGRGALAEPVDLALGAESQLYVADRGRQAVVVFDAFGSVIRTIGEGRLRGLWAVAGGDEGVYIGHSTGIDIYGFDGVLLLSYNLTLSAAPVDLTVAPDGTLYIVSSRHLYMLPPQ